MKKAYIAQEPVVFQDGHGYKAGYTVMMDAADAKPHVKAGFLKAGKGLETTDDADLDEVETR